MTSSTPPQPSPHFFSRDFNAVGLGSKSPHTGPGKAEQADQVTHGVNVAQSGTISGVRESPVRSARSNTAVKNEGSHEQRLYNGRPSQPSAETLRWRRIVGARSITEEGSVHVAACLKP